MASVYAGDVLRILLIGERQLMVQQVDGILSGRLGKYKLDWISQPELAPVRAKDLLPQLILIDDELGGADISLLVKQLVTQVPGTVILAMLKANDITQARRAVLAGARGFVTKPLNSEEVVATLRQLLSNERPVAESTILNAVAGGRVVVFCAPKGGTGRTTMMVNTCIALHQQSKKSVTLVDADYSSPALDVVLNLHDHRDISELVARASRLDAELVENVVAAHASGVRVLAAPHPADMVDPITVPQVQQIMAQLKRCYQWVMVDLGLPTDETAFAFLDSADRIVMSVLPEMVGLRNTRLMFDQLLSRGYPEHKIWLVLNRGSMKGGISQADIEQRLKVTIKHMIPDDQPLVSHSVNRGVPLIVSHPRSAVARGMSQLANELIADAVVKPEGTTAKEGVRSGVFQRFFSSQSTA